MVSRLDLDAASLSFTNGTLEDRSAVLAQWSAHGRPQLATFRNDPECYLELSVPARPVAAGQSVVLYCVDDPTIVQGAAIVIRP